MTVKRVALIFDDQTRPETTGVYCRRALENLVEVEHFLPSQLPDVPRHGFDAYINIDDGMRYPWPNDLRPNAYWAIDTHLDFEWQLAKASAFDLVFAAQKDGVPRLRDAGIASATWLPLACDPQVHRRHDVETAFDICFVGNLLSGQRTELVRLIQGRFLKTFVGQQYFDEMAQTYSASKIVFNRSVANDVNMRVFEAMACGSLLLTNDVGANGQAELFKDGVHLATYCEPEELLDKIRYYLAREVIRQRIAAAGQREVHTQHTYRHRMQTLVEALSARSGLTRSTVVATAESKAARQKVSACLVSWKRPGNIRRIVEHLRSQAIFDDIVIWNNDPSQRLELSDSNLKVIPSRKNLVTYGRYQAAQHCRHDVIYTQDDDCLVHNIDELYRAFCAEPTRIAHGLKITHLSRNDENIFGHAQMALVGWGAFFRRGWTDVLQTYRDTYGEDELLYSKADRIFSILLNRRHQSLLAKVADLPGASGPEALSVQNEHFELIDKAVSRAMALIRPAAGAPTHDQRHVRPSTHGATKASRVARNVGQSAVDRSQENVHRITDRSYFLWSRPELLPLVSQTARRILEIGCAAGRLGQSIKQRQDVKVVGIEMDPLAAEVAEEHLDKVIVGNIEEIEPEFSEGSFDCVICADVLEHLYDPAGLLKRIRRWLSADGQLVVSIPNVRHHSVITGLLDGNWTYEPAGLLDETHLRFFTKHEIEKLFYRTGYEIRRLQIMPGPGHHEWKKAGRPGKLQIGRLHAEGFSPDEVEEFFAYQFVVVGEPLQKARDVLTSIVMLTHNELQYTKQCIESIFAYTDELYELIFVDNASTDGTVEYLRALHEATVIVNKENRGFPMGVNQGILAAKGDQILLLNNDVVVTTGWLRRMLDALDSDPCVGIVGPCTSWPESPQQVALGVGDLSELDQRAWEFGKANAGRRDMTDEVLGFCMLIDRSVIDRIGLLDEQFGIGLCEDKDFCRRAAEAGFRNAIARDSYVYHFGHRTFLGSGIDSAGLFKRNRRMFHAKWKTQTNSGARG